MCTCVYLGSNPGYSTYTNFACTATAPNNSIVRIRIGELGVQCTVRILTWEGTDQGWLAGERLEAQVLLVVPVMTMKTFRE